jgi:nitrile hydratase subunit beta
MAWCSTITAASLSPTPRAHGLGDQPHHVYSVRFEARELWGDDAAPRDAVYIDLWEPYIEPAA